MWCWKPAAGQNNVADPTIQWIKEMSCNAKKVLALTRYMETQIFDCQLCQCSWKMSSRPLKIFLPAVRQIAYVPLINGCIRNLSAADNWWAAFWTRYLENSGYFGSHFSINVLNPGRLYLTNWDIFRHYIFSYGIQQLAVSATTVNQWHWLTVKLVYQQGIPDTIM